MYSQKRGGDVVRTKLSCNGTVTNYLCGQEQSRIFYNVCIILVPCIVVALIIANSDLESICVAFVTTFILFLIVTADRSLDHAHDYTLKH